MNHAPLQIRSISTAVQPVDTSPAYQKGRRAAISGARIITNPFDSVSEAGAWRDWNIGFIYQLEELGDMPREW